MSGVRPLLAESLISLAASEILQAANSVESPAIIRPYVEPDASSRGTARPAPTTISSTASIMGQVKLLRSMTMPKSMVGKGVHAFRSCQSKTRKENQRACRFREWASGSNGGHLVQRDSDVHHGRVTTPDGKD
jgi:hypothetical protein